jgi:hypothetical protein
VYKKISWSAQLLAGVTLFGVSFLLQALVLSGFLDSLVLGFAIAGGLEASKVLAIILYRILRGQDQVAYPGDVRIGALVFRALLWGLSAACSVMFLAGHLDRPHLEATRAADLAAAEQQHRTALAAFAADRTAARTDALALLKAQAAAARDDLRRRFEPSVTDLEQALDAEMDNVQGGVFRGPRYRALEERLNAEKAAWSEALAALSDADAARRAEVIREVRQETDARRAELVRTHSERVSAIRNDDYIGDARAEHAGARAAVSVLAAVFDRPFGTLQFVFYFSLYLSLTLELGIVVAFEHLTLARLPVFMAERRAELSQDAARIAARAELAGFVVQEAVKSEKVRRRRERIEDNLRDLPGGKVANDAPPAAGMRQ